MKKGSLLLMLFIAAFAVNAQVFTEYFKDATVGQDVEGYNFWYKSFKEADAAGASPKVGEMGGYFDNYAGSDNDGVYNHAILDSIVGKTDAGDGSTTGKNISTRYVVFGEDTLQHMDGETYYAAFIVSVYPHSYNSYRDFFTWEASSTGSWTRGRVFAKVVDESEVYFAVSKNSSSDLAEATTSLGLEEDHLLVLSYTAIEGDKNDEIRLYINPDPTAPKPADSEANVLVNIDTQSDYSGQQIKINLRQRGVGAHVSGIRVGKDWSEVLQGSPSGINNINAEGSKAIYSFQNTIVTSGSGYVKLFDLSGRKVMDTFTNGSLTTDVTNGIYLVRFEDENGKAYSNKVILTK